MPAPKKFKTEIEVLEHLQELPSSKVLENSSLVYTFENTPKTKELMNQLRFNDNISLEQLVTESHKVQHMKLARMGIVVESGASDFFNVKDLESVRRYITRSSQLESSNKSDAIVDVASALADAICAHTNDDFKTFDPIVAYVTTQMKDSLTYSDDIDRINSYWEARTSEQKTKAMSGDDDLEEARYSYMLVVSKQFDLINRNDDKDTYTYTDLDDAQLGTIESFQRVIENSIQRRTDMKSITAEFMVRALESQVFNDLSDFEYGDAIIEALDSSNINSVLQYEDSRDMITPKGVCNLVQLCTDLDSPFRGDSKQIENIKSALKNKVKNTVEYEMKREEYKDLPMVQGLGYSRDYLKSMYGDLKEVIDSIDEIMDEIEDFIEESVKNFMYEQALDASFKPDPFDVYQLTPFPVATRTLERSLIDIANADTDEDLESAMMNYARLESAYNHMVLTEAAKKSDKGKSKDKGANTREFVRNASNKVNSIVRSAGKKMDAAANGVKRIVDPMETFIADTINKIKKADQNERRNIIIKGGVAPKVMRWLKRGIGLVVVGSLGSTGAIISGIGLLAMIASDAHCDQKERVKILRELEDELDIVNEKIEDSRGDENKQKKYELMRIQKKLKTDIDRIKLRLKY